jgi:hypothetical protein
LATRTRGRLLLAVLLLGGAVAYFGIGEVIEWAEEVVDDVFGASYITAPEGKRRTEKCTSNQLLNDRKCGDLKVLVIDAERMPFIARNIQLAWSEGKPFILHRNSAKQAANRAAACGRFVPKYPGGSCDEHAFATTDEGGTGARVEEVPIQEQRCQGGAVNAGYAKASIRQGDAFLVVISNPSSIATKAFTGPDIAKDQSACES